MQIKPGAASTLELVPFLVRGGGEQYVVLNRETGEAISTGAVGVEALRLLTRGRTLAEIQQTLGERHRCPPADVDLAPLLDTLRDAGFIKAVDGHPVATAPPRRRRPARLYLSVLLLGPLAAWLFKYVPLGLARWVADRWLFRTSDAELEERIKTNLRRAPALACRAPELDAIAAANRANHRRLLVDRAALASLPPRRLDRWLKSGVRVSGLEHLERAMAAGTGAIVCTFHMGSYSLIPFVLAARGVALTFYAGLEAEALAGLEAWLARLAADGRPYPVRVVGGRWSLRRLAQCLTRGETILLYCDRVASGPAPARVPFLGTEIHATRGTGWLRARTGAPVLPTFLRWEGASGRSGGGGHHLIIEPLVAGSDDIVAVTAAVYARLERQVSADPAQWLKWKDLHEMLVTGAR